MNLESFEITDDHAFVLIGPIACVIWRGVMTVDAAARTEALGLRALERSPDGAGLLFFPETTTPSLELRELSTAINQRLVDGGAVGVAGVFQSPALLDAVQRGIVTGMEMLADGYPLQAFGQTIDACAWLGTLLRSREVALDVQATTAEVDDFRAAYLQLGAAWR